MTSVLHDEGTAAQQLVQKAVGQGVLVHPVGGASFSDRRKFRNFLRLAQSMAPIEYRSLTLVLRGGGGKKAKDAKKKRKCLVDAVDQVLEQFSGPRVQQHVSSGDTDGLLLGALSCLVERATKIRADCLIGCRNLLGPLRMVNFEPLVLNRSLAVKLLRRSRRMA